MHLSEEQKTLFSLIQASLWQNNEEINFSLTSRSTDWNKLISIAARQGVLAVSHDGFNKSKEVPKLSIDLLFRWELSISKLEARYKRQTDVIKELVEIFRNEGVEMLLIKGIGLSMNYPVPNHRESGDIDIYLFGNYEKGNLIMESKGIEVDKEGTKHSKFFYKGVPVENHKTLLNVQNKTDKNLEKQLQAILETQGTDNIMIDNVEVHVPTPDFNAIFLTRHDITHFLASGIVLRHFCDLAFFFEKNRERIDIVNFERLMKEEGQYNLICSFLAIAGIYLGASEDRLPFRFSVNHKIEILANKVLEDSLFNSYKSIDLETLLKMWVPRRKMIGLKNYLASKWKYDLIDKWLFYKIFIQRVYLSFF